MTEEDGPHRGDQQTAAGQLDGVPSVEDCIAFVEMINHGRSALGSGPVLGVDFDAAVPGTAHCGLSARHLFVGEKVIHLDGPAVLRDRVVRLEHSTGCKLAKALSVHFGPKRGLELPKVIVRVEEAFDDPRCHSALRARFAQAGLIKRPRLHPRGRDSADMAAGSE